jgi:hypothetical protein
MLNKNVCHVKFGEGKVVEVQGQEAPEESYRTMIEAFIQSNIKGLKEFMEG